MLRDFVRPVLLGVFAIGACIWAIVNFYDDTRPSTTPPAEKGEIEIEWLGVLDADVVAVDAAAATTDH